MALKPLHDHAGIRRVVVSTYQSVSGAGKAGEDELDRQTRAVYSLQDAVTEKFQKRIAFNLIPQIDVFMEDGYTKERVEDAGGDEEDPRSEDQAHRHLRARARLRLAFRGGERGIRKADQRRRKRAKSCARHRASWSSTSARMAATSPPVDATGEDATYISRIREDATVENGIAFWCVSDNLRKGAALNAVQIAEVLINRKLISPKAR